MAKKKDNGLFIRMLSALFLAWIVYSLAYAGKAYFAFFALLVGIQLINEVHWNMFFINKNLIKFQLKYPFSLKNIQVRLKYFLQLGILLGMFVPANFIDGGVWLKDWFLYMAVFSHCFLLICLKIVKKDADVLFFGQKYPYVITFFTNISILSFTCLFEYEYWRELAFLLLSITIAMDTGAYFIGKRFGKTKFAPEISPNKTVAGVFGGLLFAAVFPTIFSYLLAFFLFPNLMNLAYCMPLIGVIIGFISQCGDLVASKGKRHCEVKDSGKFIPGHGGVLDRIDSLLLANSFFILILKLFPQLLF